ncbi:MAG: TonB family protein [Bacteroidetes bacterium]|nr:TonB family protein [Bacteroidota bacterium]
MRYQLLSLLLAISAVSFAQSSTNPIPAGLTRLRYTADDTCYVYLNGKRYGPVKGDTPYYIDVKPGKYKFREVLVRDRKRYEENEFTMPDSWAGEEHNFRANMWRMPVEPVEFGAPTDAVEDNTPIYIPDTAEPHYYGGLTAMFDFLNKQKVYPEQDKAAGIYGRVLIYALIDTSGRVAEVELRSHVSPAIDAEAERVVRLLHFDPARAYGHAIAYSMRIPYDFYIDP